MSDWLSRHMAAVFAAVITAVVLLLVGFFVRVDETGDTDRQLCTQIEGLKTILRVDNERELAQTQEFLRDHPQGTPDISLELLERSIANTRATLRDLRPTPCGELPSG